MMEIKVGNVVVELNEKTKAANADRLKAYVERLSSLKKGDMKNA